MIDDEDDVGDGLIKGKYQPEVVTGPDTDGMGVDVEWVRLA